MVEYKRMFRENTKWIAENTEGSKTVVEFGAGFFGNLKWINKKIRKIGIEIHEPYIDNAKYHDCIKIHGDFLEFEKHLDEEDMDCALFYDAIEHVTMDQGVDLMKRVQSKFNKILLMVPEGVFIQETDYWNMGGDEYQRHKSYWFKEDVVNLGFQNIIIDSIYHKNNPEFAGNKYTGCIFAVWSKE